MGREKKAGEVEKEREREEKGEGSGREERGSAATLEGGRTKVRRMSEAEEAPRGTGVRSHRRQDEHDEQDVQDGSLLRAVGAAQAEPAQNTCGFSWSLLRFASLQEKRPGIMDGRANVRIPGLSKGGDQSYP